MRPKLTFKWQTWSQYPRTMAIALFVIALLPRLPGLGTFLTSDENTNIFYAGSDVIAAFLQGDFRATYWHFYPGVTMSWLDAIGLAGQYLFDLASGRPVPEFNDYLYGDILSLVVASRLPYAMLTALAVPATYLLARQLLSDPIALLGSLFMAFDPFYLAHSRVAHGDAPVAVFMSLSALTFFIYLVRYDRQEIVDAGQRAVKSDNVLRAALRAIARDYRSLLYLVASAIFGSLAALTKAPGQFMALFVIIMCVIGAIQEFRRSNSDSLPTIHYPLITIVSRWLTIIALWGVVSLSIFILLWPSMWVDPAGTFGQMWAETFGKVNEGHLVYFFGQPTLDPGPWFYVYVIPFRLTPIILLGSALSLLFFVPKWRPFANLTERSPEVAGWLSPLFLLWFFTLTLLLFGNLSPKKQDRYLLPLFPFLNLIAAIGWLGTFYLIGTLLRSKTNRMQLQISNYQLPITNFLLFILLALHFSPILTYYPYYLTYFNPLMGGPTRAAETTLMGWGEGMEQVAAYLNAKPNAEQLYVASTPSQTLLPYFVGTGENFYTNDIAFRADYVVLYLAQMQRLAPSPEIVSYFERQEPETTIAIQGVPYAKIYQGPKFILSDIPSEAKPLNIGLADKIRLAGYDLPEAQSQNAVVSASTTTLQLTLYWHALAPLEENYTVSMRAKSASGDLIAQKDSWPVTGLLATSEWRQGDYVADTHTLEILSDVLTGLDHLEIVVYHQQTGETLGPPITLPSDGLWPQ